MSWDISIMIDTGGTEPARIEEVRNLTYNNGNILRILRVHVENIGNDNTCAFWLMPLQEAQVSLDTPVFCDMLKTWEPLNKWGGIDDVKDFVNKLLGACKRHPNAYVHWS